MAKINFVRSGFAHMGHSFLRLAGVTGIYWSRSSTTAIIAYNLRFDASAVNSLNGPYDRSYGFSLRCLQEQEAKG